MGYDGSVIATSEEIAQALLDHFGYAVFATEGREYRIGEAAHFVSAGRGFLRHPVVVIGPSTFEESQQQCAFLERRFSPETFQNTVCPESSWNFYRVTAE